MAGSRIANESPVFQGAAEKLAYGLTTTPWGASPTNESMAVYDITDPENEEDVTAACTEASMSVSGNVITTKRIKSLTLGNTYRVEVLFTDAQSNVWEMIFLIKCQDK